jgi:hypothetical protein
MSVLDPEPADVPPVEAIDQIRIMEYLRGFRAGFAAFEAGERDPKIPLSDILGDGFEDSYFKLADPASISAARKRPIH